MQPDNLQKHHDTSEEKSKLQLINHEEASNSSGTNKISCPYLNTIDRKALDFDFEKVCSVSLSKTNVYACLVCGKYFQGRGRSTHAFIHSVSEFHYVFLNLETLKIYCLPDNYEVEDSCLDDILYVVRPTFTKDDINQLDKIEQPVQAYDGKLYYPGIVGLNNLKFNDYCNVIFQALSHVIPLRDYFLMESNYALVKSGDNKYILLQRFGELIRKLWNPRNFKAHVSPHEMLQAIVLTSRKKFEITKQNDPIVFLVWFLNSIMGPKREKNSIINETFEGKIRVLSRLVLPNVAATKEDDPAVILANDEKADITSFLYLTLTIPSMPLFPKKDEKGKVIKPRVSIYELLRKYDGDTTHEYKSQNETAIRRYEILKLPKYLIFYIKRFTKNTFFVEKNTHVVDFPINNLNLSNFLKNSDCKQVSDQQQQKISKCYNLIVNIVHDGDPELGKGTYRAHILHRGTGKWFEMQDLYVTELPDTSLISLSESYIQIWELKE